MKPTDKSVSVTTRVPFHDCDPLFVVWHGRFFEYFALARTELFRQLQLDIPQIRELGFRMYVTASYCRHMCPLSYGEAAKISARITRLLPTLRVSYQIENITQGRKSARGYTELATTDAAGVLLPSLPQVIMERLCVPDEISSAVETKA